MRHRDVWSWLTAVISCGLPCLEANLIMTERPRCGWLEPICLSWGLLKHKGDGGTQTLSRTYLWNNSRCIYFILLIFLAVHQDNIKSIYTTVQKFVACNNFCFVFWSNLKQPAIIWLKIQNIQTFVWSWETFCVLTHYNFRVMSTIKPITLCITAILLWRKRE